MTKTDDNNTVRCEPAFREQTEIIDLTDFSHSNENGSIAVEISVDPNPEPERNLGTENLTANNGTTNNGTANNGTANNGMVSNGTAINGTTNNGTVNTETANIWTANSVTANNRTANNTMAARGSECQSHNETFCCPCCLHVKKDSLLNQLTSLIVIMAAAMLFTFIGCFVAGVTYGAESNSNISLKEQLTWLDNHIKSLESTIHHIKFDDSWMNQNQDVGHNTRCGGLIKIPVESLRKPVNSFVFEYKSKMEYGTNERCLWTIDNANNNSSTHPRKLTIQITEISEGFSRTHQTDSDGDFGAGDGLYALEWNRISGLTSEEILGGGEYEFLSEALFLSFTSDNQSEGGTGFSLRISVIKFQSESESESESGSKSVQGNSQNSNNWYFKTLSGRKIFEGITRESSHKTSTLVVSPDAAEAGRRNVKQTTFNVKTRINLSDNDSDSTGTGLAIGIQVYEIHQLGNITNKLRIVSPASPGTNTSPSNNTATTQLISINATDPILSFFTWDHFQAGREHQALTVSWTSS